MTSLVLTQKMTSSQWQRIWLLKSCLESCFISFLFFSSSLEGGGLLFYFTVFYLFGRKGG